MLSSTSAAATHDVSEATKFVERNRCITCLSSQLERLSGGSFGDDPLRSYIAADPWGESPLPYLKDESWEFVRCRDCQQMFHKRILSPAWQDRLYRDWVTDAAIREFEAQHGVTSPSTKLENGRNNVRHVLRVEKMTRALRAGETLKILDFGCGWGQFLAAASLFGAEACGVDRDADRLRGAAGVGVRLAPSLDDLPAELKGRFDVVSLFQVLEHLEEPRPVLEMLRGWLRPGGILILETPNCTGITGFDSIENYRDINPLAHINAFTPETLTSIATRTGYTPVQYVPAHATADLLGVAKSQLKGVLGGFKRIVKPTTDQYFRRD